MRGLEKVRAEFSLTALAYNLRRVLNIVGLPKLLAARLKVTSETLPIKSEKIAVRHGIGQIFFSQITRLRKRICGPARRRKQCFHTVCVISATRRGQRRETCFLKNRGCCHSSQSRTVNWEAADYV
jgi:hypothetical protein